MQAVVERIQAKAELADDRQQLLGLLCLAVVHTHICASLPLDKKLIKGLLDLHHKVPSPAPSPPSPCPVLPQPVLPLLALPCVTLPRPAHPALPCPALPCPVSPTHPACHAQSFMIAPPLTAGLVYLP